MLKDWWTFTNNSYIHLDSLNYLKIVIYLLNGNLEFAVTLGINAAFYQRILYNYLPMFFFSKKLFSKEKISRSEETSFILLI